MNVDHYLMEGCGRCKLVGTPECKVHTWPDELRLLRSIALSSGLQEEIKWSMPCYTYNGKNVAMIAAFKHNVVLSFFKGSLLQDEMKILEKPGDNSNVSRIGRYTSVSQIVEVQDYLKAYLLEAIELEKAGKKVAKQKAEALVLPKELEAAFALDTNFEKAFRALTPGKQRAYVIHISEAKQEATRISRVEKYKPQILQGLAIHDAYMKKK